MYKKTEAGVQKHLKLLSPRPEVVSVLDMVGFASFFEIFTDKRSAIEFFNLITKKRLRILRRIVFDSQSGEDFARTIFKYDHF